MKIHEYQAKKILRDYAIAIPRGDVADSPELAKKIAFSLDSPVIIKAQVHAGGRGKAGGIRPASSPEEAFGVAKELLRMTLVGPQTGPEGKCVRKVLVEEACPIGKELYIGLSVDRSRHRECLVFIASATGGIDIEETATSAPEKILTAAVPPAAGYSSFLARKLGYGIGLTNTLIYRFDSILEKLYWIFFDKNASLIEINPLIITPEHNFIALDAKIAFDDSGLFRHPDILAMRDQEEEAPLEAEAKNAGITYIKLKGTVGCMVNGAGLAMATMDLIKLFGGEPANFLDVGGGASPKQVGTAFQILTSDPGVKVILVNIFGGILRCDQLASGLIEAAANIKEPPPMVVRLQGTNREEGRRLLQKSDLRFQVAEDLSQAARMAVELSMQS